MKNNRKLLALVNARTFCLAAKLAKDKPQIWIYDVSAREKYVFCWYLCARCDYIQNKLSKCWMKSFILIKREKEKKEKRKLYFEKLSNFCLLSFGAKAVSGEHKSQSLNEKKARKKSKSIGFEQNPFAARAILVLESIKFVQLPAKICSILRCA